MSSSDEPSFAEVVVFGWLLATGGAAIIVACCLCRCADALERLAAPVAPVAPITTGVEAR